VAKRLLRALPVIILVSIFTLFLDHYGWLRSFETDALDRFFVLREKVPAHDVVLVEIDDDDYRQLFHETSPLDPPTLTDVIDAIAKNQPKMIAVDIDTSATVFRTMKISSEWPPIVWARGAHQVGTESNTVTLEGVLGSAEPRADLPSGIAIMPLDIDSKIRHFQRQYLASNRTTAQASVLRVDSFHWAIFRKYCEVAKVDDRCKDLFLPQTDRESFDNDLILNLAIDPYAFDPRIRASQVLDQANTGNAGGSSPVFLSIKDKIVLLGGNYAAAADYHATASGIKSGTELTAIAVESELSKTGLRQANRFVLVIMEVVAGLALVLLNYFFPAGWKHLLTLASIPVLALLGSWIAFASLALWANFIPTLVATQLHRLYDRLKDTKRLTKEVADLRATIQTYEHGPQEKNIDDSAAPESADDKKNPSNNSFV
jgi:CHASE2 domain-containing sensor protein